MEGGGWRVEGGGWRVEGGGWRVEGGHLPLGREVALRADKDARHVVAADGVHKLLVDGLKHLKGAADVDGVPAQMLQKCSHGRVGRT